MTLPRRAAVVGLGLIGGSIARDLAAAGVGVAGWDADAASLASAVRSGVVHEALDATFARLSSAELVVLAVPVGSAGEVLRAVARGLSSAAVVTDTGSTKAGIVAAARDLGLASRFVGSHPLAGDHRSGWDASREGLFQGARVYLCADSAVTQTSLDAVSALWRTLGAATLVMHAEEHDRLLAYTSHLPQLVSSALAVALARRGIPRDALGPGGRDVTRLAGSSAEMWSAIARENADEITGALALVEGELHAIREAVRDGRSEVIHDALTTAARWHGVRV